MNNCTRHGCIVPILTLLLAACSETTVYENFYEGVRARHRLEKAPVRLEEDMTYQQYEAERKMSED